MKNNAILAEIQNRCKYHIFSASSELMAAAYYRVLNG